MDNRQTIPGYKHYVDRQTGDRGAWFVTFLNIVRDPSATVNGVLFEVDDSLLGRLDERERNYERIDVTAHTSSEKPSGRVWVYVGSPAARERFELGARSDSAVISREYYDGVREDFACAGADALRRFDALTDPVPCPVLDLRRIDHPPAGRFSVKPLPRFPGRSRLGREP